MMLLMKLLAYCDTDVNSMTSNDQKVMLDLISIVLT